MIQLIYLIIGLILTIIAFSGFASIIRFNDMMVYVSGVAVIIYIFLNKKNDYKLISPQINIIVTVGCIIEFIYLILDYTNITQILNYVTLFGVIIGVKLLSLLKWEKMNWFFSGTILWIASWILIQMFLPEHTLSGWNPNSSIGIVPVSICALSLIYCNKGRLSLLIFLTGGILTLLPIIELKNRSAMFAIVAFGVIALPPVWKVFNSKHIFRCFYIGILLFNVILPFNYRDIESTDTMENALEISQEVTEKDKGYNDREELWDIGREILNEAPIIGHAGQRGIYLHNFSIDVLTQFGWLGWIIFAIMYCSLMERCYRYNSKFNIFLFGFGCVLLLNSFENVLFACNVFSIFPYILFAIPWRLLILGKRKSLSFS